MEYRRKILTLAVGVALAVAPVIAGAQQSPSGNSPAANPATAAPSSTQGASSQGPTLPLSRLLPEKLAGVKATGDIKQYGGDSLRDLVADKATAYQEYLVGAAASRQYAAGRVDVFEAQTLFAAFGLFTYNSPGEAAHGREAVGSGSAYAEGSLIFWKGNYFVRVTADGDQSPHNKPVTALARAVASLIAPPQTSATHPPLIESLPTEQIVSGSLRYFLGPESLNRYVERGREMFGFAGDAEAVVAEYPTPVAAAAPQPPMKLVIVEYHTPQFATDAMARVTGYIDSLPEQEQARFIIRREGNYIVEAANVTNREFAQSKVDSVKYPYTVKWLRDPLLPTTDAFHGQKAAEMLLSTFGLLGLILLTVLVGGAVFGTTIFLKRRKQQQEIFSDAGGMLRLDIDPFEATLLGLPPKRDEG